MKKGGILGVIAGLILWAGISEAQTLKEGLWRGVFQVGNEEVPFQLDIRKSGGKYTAAAINGKRRDEFSLVFTGKDSLKVVLNTFEAVLLAKLEGESIISGAYQTLATPPRKIPFRAEAGSGYRFIPVKEQVAPLAVIAGRYDVKITNVEGAPDRVAVFEQNGNQLNGIFLSITGDSRDLQGEISGDRFYLSGFTGSSPVLVTGKVLADGTLEGSLGTAVKTNFKAVKNASAALPDAYSLTYLKDGYDRLDLSLPDLNGKLVSLQDDKYKGKVVVIELLGSWCPNCIDQVEFISPWFKANKSRGVEVIGVAFEVKDDIEYARKVVGKLRDRYDIQYDLLFGGKADKNVVAQKFAALNSFLAFPTTIVIGRDGRVREIHTGFSGKGTGVFYEEYVERFTADLNKLISEPIP